MKGSMVSRKPSGSKRAPPAIKRDEHAAGLQRRLPVGRISTRGIGEMLAARKLHQHADGQRDADEAQPERKEARPRAQGVGQRIAERGDQGGR